MKLILPISAMQGPVVITILGGSVAGALLPLVVGVLASSVAYGRTRCTV